MTGAELADVSTTLFIVGILISLLAHSLPPGA